MTSPMARTGALAVILLALAVMLAAPASASSRPGGEPPARPPARVAAEESSGGATRWLMIGSGLLLGVGIGVAFTFLRKGSSSDD